MNEEEQIHEGLAQAAFDYDGAPGHWLLARMGKRVLRPGGREKPDTIASERKEMVQRELAHAIRVNARPLTVEEWKAVLTEAGLRVEAVHANLMHLLKPARIVADEGLPRALRIAFNILRTPAARRRVMQMRRVLNRYAADLGAVAIVAVKP